MTPETIIREAQADGVSVALSPAGTIKVNGGQAAVNRWLPIIRENKPGILAALREPRSRGWQVKYPDGSMIETYVLPEPTRAEVLRDYPGAIAAEPIPEAAKRIPTAPMTAEEEAAIRAWVAYIEETDPATIADVLHQCRTDADAREYFVRRAEEVRR